MSAFTPRVLGTVAAVCVAAACGTFLGYWAGRHVVMRHEEAKLDQFAARVMEETETSSGEARAILAELNASRNPRCSDAELSYFRGLLFRSQYLKDTGRMRDDGRVDCSASFGRIREEQPQAKEPIVREDGVRLYIDLPIFQRQGMQVVTVQQRDAFVVYNPFNLNSLQSPGIHFTITDRSQESGKARPLAGESPKVDDAILLHEGLLHAGGNLYATRCSARFRDCITAYTPIEDTIHADRGELRTYVVLSGLSGALFGLACAGLYRRSRSIVQQLRRAIRRDRLQLMYQPIFDLRTGRIVAAEALARWTDEDGYIVSPELFISIAEQSGFAGDITRVVVRRAVRDLKAILGNFPDFRVNVNITATDLAQSSFLPMLERTLVSAEVDAARLGIEITEGSTARRQVAKEAILMMRRMGHCVHIDDFGTGYSSLAYLHDLAVDAIKIDKAFTQSIGTDSVQVSILPQILSMAASLDLMVVVEGIETEEQARYFERLDHPVMAQGWYFGRPIPVEELMRRLLQQAAIPSLSGARAS